MKSNQEFEEEVDNLIKESVSKHHSFMKDEEEIKEKKSKKQFFYNRNKIDINEAWREIEQLFQNFSIQEKKEEQTIIGQIEILQTPQSKIHSLQILTTKTKEEQKLDNNTNKILKFNLE